MKPGEPAVEAVIPSTGDVGNDSAPAGTAAFDVGSVGAFFGVPDEAGFDARSSDRDEENVADPDQILQVDHLPIALPEGAKFRAVAAATASEWIEAAAAGSAAVGSRPTLSHYLTRGQLFG
jgi:hypothetical protein